METFTPETLVQFAPEMLSRTSPGLEWLLQCPGGSEATFCISDFPLNRT